MRRAPDPKPAEEMLCEERPGCLDKGSLRDFQTGADSQTVNSCAKSALVMKKVAQSYCQNNHRGYSDVMDGPQTRPEIGCASFLKRCCRNSMQ